MCLLYSHITTRSLFVCYFAVDFMAGQLNRSVCEGFGNDFNGSKEIFHQDVLYLCCGAKIINCTLPVLGVFCTITLSLTLPDLL